MTRRDINRRLDRLAGGNGFEVAASLDAARQRARAWRDAGNIGPMPCKPLAPPLENATRADRKMWRTITEARARVAFIPNGELDELSAAYAMNDDDLWRTVSQREQAAEQTNDGRPT
jgi:hypothetical protein